MGKKPVYHSLPANGITKPLVGASAASLPVVAIASAASLPVVANASAASLPVVANASAASLPVVANASATSLPVGAIASAASLPVVEESLQDVSDNVIFATAAARMYSTNNVRKQSMTGVAFISNVASSANESIGKGYFQSLSLPKSVSDFFRNLIMLCYKNNILISWKSAQDIIALDLAQWRETPKQIGITFSYITLSYYDSTRCWGIYFHNLNVSVFVDPLNTSVVGIQNHISDTFPTKCEASQSIIFILKSLNEHYQSGTPIVARKKHYVQHNTVERPSEMYYNDGHFPVVGVDGPTNARRVAHPVARPNAHPVAHPDAHPVARQNAPAVVTSASNVSKTSEEVSTIAVAPTVVAQVVAPVKVVHPVFLPIAIASTVVASEDVPETVSPEDPELLAFKRQQAIYMAKFKLTQIHKRVVLDYEAKFKALDAEEQLLLQSFSQDKKQSK